MHFGVLKVASSKKKRKEGFSPFVITNCNSKVWERKKCIKNNKRMVLAMSLPWKGGNALATK
jgi:hypothetical protein